MLLCSILLLPRAADDISDSPPSWPLPPNPSHPSSAAALQQAVPHRGVRRRVLHSLQAVQHAAQSGLASQGRRYKHTHTHTDTHVFQHPLKMQFRHVLKRHKPYVKGESEFSGGGLDDKSDEMNE